MSFKISNTTVSQAVNQSLIATNNRNANIAFCNATICSLPYYSIFNGDTGGNVPGGANSNTGSYYINIPFDHFNGINKHFYFDGSGYFYTYEPGYYKCHVSFSGNITDTSSPPVDMILKMMNQSGGEDNLTFPFVADNNTTQYSFSGILPASFYDNDYELHFAFETNATTTFVVQNITVSVSFYI